MAEYAKGNCFNHPSALMVELAEYMVDLIPFADWAVFAKNGSDVTTWATLVAREATHRKKIVACKGEYHGAHPWCTPGHGGVIEEDRANMLYFTWNKIEELRALFDNHKGQIAGVIMTPFHHPAFGDMELPAPGFWQGVRRLCDENGAVLILDDVRCGFRLDIRGSNYYFGFEPDISCYCKAIANGYPLSAAVGRDKLKQAASNVFLTGSYWNSSAPMAAGLATIKLLRETDGIKKMNQLGEMLMNGLTERGKAAGYEMIATGPGAIPFIRFGNENNFMRMQVFAAEMSKRGHFCHPHHNWFMSAAHTEADIEETLDAAEGAFAAVKKQFGD
jgi:glutamate-1-semialdehyde 2,1-aminomutase